MLLSSSRVYSIAALAALPLRPTGDAFELDVPGHLPAGVSARRASREEFSTRAPGFLLRRHQSWRRRRWRSNMAKLSVFRSGSTAAACWPAPGQFGTAEQGIFSYWLNAHCGRRPAALHRLRRARQAGAGRLASARPGRPARRADAPAARLAASASTTLGGGIAERHVAGAIDGLVRLRGSAPSLPWRTCTPTALSTFPGW